MLCARIYRRKSYCEEIIFMQCGTCKMKAAVRDTRGGKFVFAISKGNAYALNRGNILRNVYGTMWKREVNQKWIDLRGSAWLIWKEMHAPLEIIECFSDIFNLHKKGKYNGKNWRSCNSVPCRASRQIIQFYKV